MTDPTPTTAAVSDPTPTPTDAPTPPVVTLADAEAAIREAQAALTAIDEDARSLPDRRRLAVEVGDGEQLVRLDGYAALLPSRRKAVEVRLVRAQLDREVALMPQREADAAAARHALHEAAERLRAAQAAHGPAVARASWAAEAVTDGLARIKTLRGRLAWLATAAAEDPGAVVRMPRRGSSGALTPRPGDDSVASARGETRGGHST